VPAAWRHQTLVRKGVCLEALKRPDEALEAYYDVLGDALAASAPSGSGAAEDYWLHRAGGKALNLLEKARKYEEAIEIAKKLAKAPGPRGRAAAELVDELALKYGIWTSSP
jgi:tetratricopeptide (TPR) repeat protein